MEPSSRQSKPNVHAEINALVKDLSSRKPAVREAAEKALRSLSAGQLDEIVRVLRAEPKKSLARLGWWFAIVAWPMILGPVWATSGYDGVLPMPLRLLCFGGFIAVYLALFPRLVAKPAWQNALRYCYANVESVKMLGPQMYHASAQSGPAVPASLKMTAKYGATAVSAEEMEQALTRTIHSIVSADDIDLTNDERNALRTLLRSNNAELVKDLLRVVEMVGNVKDLEIVRALARGRHAAKSDARLQEKAQICQQILESRLQRLQGPDTLLRASANTSQNSSLLKPVVSAPGNEAQQLLRVSEASEPGAQQVVGNAQGVEEHRLEIVGRE